jgi:hypothetical protein
LGKVKLRQSEGEKTIKSFIMEKVTIAVVCFGILAALASNTTPAADDKQIYSKAKTDSVR